jgi:uncharacterized protein GlcG (DUF336 family)
MLRPVLGLLRAGALALAGQIIGPVGVTGGTSAEDGEVAHAGAGSMK